MDPCKEARRLRLTDDAHLAEVHPHPAEGGEPGGRVVLPAGAVLPSAAVVGALGGVVQPETGGTTVGSLCRTEKRRAGLVSRKTGHPATRAPLPEAEDL